MQDRNGGNGLRWGGWRWAAVQLAALAMVTAACGEDKPPATKTDVEQDTGEEQDIAADSGDGQGDASPADGSQTDAAAGDADGTTGPDGDSAVTPDGTDTGDGTGTTDATGDAPTDPDSKTPGSDAASDADAVVKPKLPLPDCAQGNCLNCLNPAKCPVQQICVDGTTFANDCDAICKLQAFEGLDKVAKTLLPKACPDCEACATTFTKCNTQTLKCAKCDNGKCTDGAKDCKANADCANAFEACATLKTGAKVTINLPCMATCMDVDPKINVSNGACKSTCSQPAPNGGNCPMDAYQPVCAKEDGKSYATTCAMNHCDLAGCFGLGETAKSASCTANAMTKECEGECFADAIKVSETAKNCPKDCAPVCGITKIGKGQSYRNQCLAENAGAKVGDCTGISTTATDQCSAGYFKAKPCCPDVKYGPADIKQVCASRQSDKPDTKDTWVTFRNAAEFKCLTAGDGKWTQQYLGPCICDCSDVAQPVCGADGLTYTNACQAKCYNGDSFDTKNGPC